MANAKRRRPTAKQVRQNAAASARASQGYAMKPATIVNTRSPDGTKKRTIKPAKVGKDTRSEFARTRHARNAMRGKSPNATVRYNQQIADSVGRKSASRKRKRTAAGRFNDPRSR